MLTTLSTWYEYNSSTVNAKQKMITDMVNLKCFLSTHVLLSRSVWLQHFLKLLKSSLKSWSTMQHSHPGSDIVNCISGVNLRQVVTYANVALCEILKKTVVWLVPEKFMW